MSLPPEPTRTVLEDELTRRKRQREESDSRYDEALTALDAALWPAPQFPHAPPGPDESQVTRFNLHWDILRVKPAAPAGWRGRVAQIVWELVEPLLAAFTQRSKQHFFAIRLPVCNTVKISVFG